MRKSDVFRLGKFDGPTLGERGRGGDEGEGGGGRAYIPGVYIRDSNWVTYLGGLYSRVLIILGVY